MGCDVVPPSGLECGAVSLSLLLGVHISFNAAGGYISVQNFSEDDNCSIGRFFPDSSKNASSEYAIDIVPTTVHARLSFGPATSRERRLTFADSSCNPFGCSVR